jgi:hypothetical protein
VPVWLKAISLVIGLGGWLATVVTTLMRDGIPDATTLGVPVALVIALAPPVTLPSGRGTTTAEPAGQVEN